MTRADVCRQKPLVEPGVYIRQMLTSGIQFHMHKHPNGTFYTSLFRTKTILLIDDEEQEYKPDLYQTSLRLHTFQLTDIL